MPTPTPTRSPNTPSGFKPGLQGFVSFSNTWGSAPLYATGRTRDLTWSGSYSGTASAHYPKYTNAFACGGVHKIYASIPLQVANNFDPYYTRYGNFTTDTRGYWPIGASRTTNAGASAPSLNHAAEGIRFVYANRPNFFASIDLFYSGVSTDAFSNRGDFYGFSYAISDGLNQTSYAPSDYTNYDYVPVNGLAGYIGILDFKMSGNWSYSATVMECFLYLGNGPLKSVGLPDIWSPRWILSYYAQAYQNASRGDGGAYTPNAYTSGPLGSGVMIVDVLIPGTYVNMSMTTNSVLSGDFTLSDTHTLQRSTLVPAGLSQPALFIRGDRGVLHEFSSGAIEGHVNYDNTKAPYSVGYKGHFAGSYSDGTITAPIGVTATEPGPFSQTTYDGGRSDGSSYVVAETVTFGPTSPFGLGSASDAGTVIQGSITTEFLPKYIGLVFPAAINTPISDWSVPKSARPYFRLRTMDRPYNADSGVNPFFGFWVSDPVITLNNLGIDYDGFITGGGTSYASGQLIANLTPSTPHGTGLLQPYAGTYLPNGASSAFMDRIYYYNNRVSCVNPAYLAFDDVLNNFYIEAYLEPGDLDDIGVGAVDTGSGLYFLPVNTTGVGDTLFVNSERIFDYLNLKQTGNFAMGRTGDKSRVFVWGDNNSDSLFNRPQWLTNLGNFIEYSYTTYPDIRRFFNFFIGDYLLGPVGANPTYNFPMRMGLFSTSLYDNTSSVVFPYEDWADVRGLISGGTLPAIELSRQTTYTVTDTPESSAGNGSDLVMQAISGAVGINCGSNEDLWEFSRESSPNFTFSGAAVNGTFTEDEHANIILNTVGCMPKNLFLTYKVEQSIGSGFSYKISGLASGAAYYLKLFFLDLASIGAIHLNDPKVPYFNVTITGANTITCTVNIFEGVYGDPSTKLGTAPDLIVFPENRTGGCTPFNNTSPVYADSNGTLTIQFVGVTGLAMVSGIYVTPHVNAFSAINMRANATGQVDWNGGWFFNRDISTALGDVTVSNASLGQQLLPIMIGRPERPMANLNYTATYIGTPKGTTTVVMQGYNPNTLHSITIHFSVSEQRYVYYSTNGGFDIVINGEKVESSLDPYGTFMDGVFGTPQGLGSVRTDYSGGPYSGSIKTVSFGAMSRQYFARSDSSGKFTIQFSVNQSSAQYGISAPYFNGVEIYRIFDWTGYRYLKINAQISGAQSLTGALLKIGNKSFQLPSIGTSAATFTIDLCQPVADYPVPPPSVDSRQEAILGLDNLDPSWGIANARRVVFTNIPNGIKLTVNSMVLNQNSAPVLEIMMSAHGLKSAFGVQYSRGFSAVCDGIQALDVPYVCEYYNHYDIYKKTYDLYIPSYAVANFVPNFAQGNIYFGNPGFYYSRYGPSPNDQNLESVHNDLSIADVVDLINNLPGWNAKVRQEILTPAGGNLPLINLGCPACWIGGGGAIYTGSGEFTEDNLWQDMVNITVPDPTNGGKVVIQAQQLIDHVFDWTPTSGGAFDAVADPSVPFSTDALPLRMNKIMRGGENGLVYNRDGTIATSGTVSVIYPSIPPQTMSTTPVGSNGFYQTGLPYGIGESDIYQLQNGSAVQPYKAARAVTAGGALFNIPNWPRRRCRQSIYGSNPPSAHDVSLVRDTTGQVFLLVLNTKGQMACSKFDMRTEMFSIQSVIDSATNCSDVSAFMHVGRIAGVYLRDKTPIFAISFDHGGSFTLITIPGTFNAVAATEHLGRIVVLGFVNDPAPATTGVWYCVVGKDNLDGTYTWSAQQSLGLVNATSSGDVKSRSDGVVEFAWIDSSGMAYITRGRNIGLSGAGVWS